MNLTNKRIILGSNELINKKLFTLILIIKKKNMKIIYYQSVTKSLMLI